MRSAVSVEIPERLREVLTRGKRAADLPRWATEAMVVSAVREGLITGGLAGHILGLSFTEREDFLAEHGIVHDESVEELRAQQEAIEAVMRRP